MSGEKDPKTLWIKRRFLEEILAGRKTLEVRVSALSSNQGKTWSFCYGVGKVSLKRVFN